MLLLKFKAINAPYQGVFRRFVGLNFFFNSLLTVLFNFYFTESSLTTFLLR